MLEQRQQQHRHRRNGCRLGGGTADQSARRDDKYAYYNLGFIAQTRGNKSDAESQYKLALAIDPKYDPALYNLAILRTAAGDTQGAVTLYQQAIAANAKDANAHFNLGLLLRQTGHTAAGNTQIQDAVQLQPALRAQAQAAGVTVR